MIDLFFVIFIFSHDFQYATKLYSISPVTQIEGEEYTDFLLQNGQFIVPDKKGTYYYMLSANWASPTEEHVSLGQTSVMFFIKVV